MENIENVQVNDPIPVEATPAPDKKPYKRPVTMTDKKRQAIAKMQEGLKKKREQEKEAKKKNTQLNQASDEIYNKINNLTAELEKINKKISETKKEESNDIIITKPVEVEKKPTPKQQETKQQYISPATKQMMEAQKQQTQSINNSLSNSIDLEQLAMSNINLLW